MPGYLSYAQTVLADSPRAYYQLEFNAAAGTFPADSSGNALDMASVSAGISVQQPGAAQIPGYSLLFHSASSEFTARADNNLLDLGDVFTLEGWVKRASTGANHGIISKGSGAYYLRINSSDQLNLLRSQTANIVSSTTTITDTTSWHHVVATKNGATVKLYIDGADVTGSVSNSTCVDNTSDFGLAEDVGGGEFFDGYLDEVAVYATELSAARVLAHYLAATVIPTEPLRVLPLFTGARGA